MSKHARGHMDGRDAWKDVCEAESTVSFQWQIISFEGECCIKVYEAFQCG
jgi:hypothetical protein